MARTNESELQAAAYKARMAGREAIECSMCRALVSGDAERLAGTVQALIALGPLAREGRTDWQYARWYMEETRRPHTEYAEARKADLQRCAVERARGIGLWGTAERTTEPETFSMGWRTRGTERPW